MARKQIIPSLRRHRPSQRAVVTLSGHDHYLGPWPDEQEKPGAEVQADYDRLIAEWLANGRQSLVEAKVEIPGANLSQGLCIGDLIVRFMHHAKVHYADPESGHTGKEYQELQFALRPLRDLYPSLPIDEFGPLRLKAIRERMIADGLSRGVVNHRIQRVIRMVKWGVSEELVGEPIWRALKSVRGLQAGRTAAHESPPVVPVEDSVITATLPHLSADVAAMVRFQRLTGLRPGEVCKLRMEEIDTTGAIWLWRPTKHKTAWRGKARVAAIGPQAQEVLRPFIHVRCLHCDDADRANRLKWKDGLCYRCADKTAAIDVGRRSNVPTDYYLFSPAESMSDWAKTRGRARRTQSDYGNRPGHRSGGLRKDRRRDPGTRYTPSSYGHAVARACDLADVEHWSPNQLRHSHATEVRKLYGLEAAQVALGHSRADVTQVYAERDLTLALKIAAEIG